MRITVNSKRAEVQVKRSVEPDKWNHLKGCAVGKDRKHQEINLYLETVRNRVFQIHRQLEADGKPITEPYYGELAEFCFTRENRFFKGIRSVCTPQAILDKEADRHMELIRRKAFLLKGKDTPVGDNDTDLWHMTPYSFSVDGKAPVFLCNLVYRDDRRQARTDMTHTLKSLRNSHYRYCWGKGTYETPDCLMDRAFQEDLTIISGGCFFQYPTNRESATFFGQVKETGEEFLFRIYDRDYFLYLLKRLRTVKRENCMENISDSSTLKAIL